MIFIDACAQQAALVVALRATFAPSLAGERMVSSFFKVISHCYVGVPGRCHFEDKVIQDRM